MPSDSLRGLKEFHESYYDHSCTIFERKKDVLKTDIPGHHFKSKLERWWHGLFLINYGDRRSRSYYTSSEALRRDRTKQFRNYKGRIHPLSKFRNFWDGMMLILFIVRNVSFHHNTSIVYGNVYKMSYFAGLCIEIIIIIDVFVNIKTGYIDEEARRVILDKYEGVLHYCSTKLFFHVVSAIPLQWLMVLRYGKAVGCELCKANLFVLTLKLLGVFGLFRIYEYSSYWARDRNSFNWTCFWRLFRIFMLGLMTVLYIQDISYKITLMIMISEGKILETSLVGILIHHKYVDPEPAGDYTLYLFTFVRATKAVVLLNFSYANDYYLDKLIFILTNMVVYGFHIWSIFEIYTFLCKIYFCENDDLNVKKWATQLACYRQLPDNITKKICKYYDSPHARMKLIEDRNLFFETLPQTLKDDIFLTSYKHYVKNIPYFADWPPEVVEEMSLLLKEDIYLNNDLVAEPWVPNDGLTIVAVGEVAVYNDDLERGHLINGDFFGELSLVTDKELRTSTVVAITSCVILLLDKILFRKLMRDHQELFSELSQQLKEKFNQNTATQNKNSSNPNIRETLL